MSKPKPKPRKIQEIFNTVIDSGYYNPDDPETFESSSYMCLALSLAHRDGVITYKEYIKARGLIANYIRPRLTLRAALLLFNLPYSAKEKMKIYRNWKHKPKLQRGEKRL